MVKRLSYDEEIEALAARILVSEENNIAHLLRDVGLEYHSSANRLLRPVVAASVARMMYRFGVRNDQ
jgi:hypothetical protein